MKLHEHMDQALDRLQPGDPDLGQLAAGARARGLSRRRRRSAALAAGAVLTTVALAGILGSSLSGDGDRQAPHAAGQRSSSAPTTSATAGDGLVPATHRGIAAALADAVAQERQGEASDFAGQGGELKNDNNFYAELHWHDADGAGVSVVGINVQVHGKFVSRCNPQDPQQADCQEATLPNGDKLTTYTETTPGQDGMGVRRVADLLRADGVRIAISATNGFQLPKGGWHVTRPQPPLTTDQLVTIAKLGVWGDRLPQSLVEAGAALSPYVDLDAGIEASGAPVCTSSNSASSCLPNPISSGS